MNKILKTPIDSLGYQFVDPAYLPAGKDEYYLRNEQAPARKYRNLTTGEIAVLVSQGNTSDNWSAVLVSGTFHPELVQLCKFYGLVRIGDLEKVYLQFHDIRLQAGLYNSTIISCDIGDNNVINNVNYLSHYILGDEVILVNINEMEVSDHAKFGNGIVKQGEPESVRIWLELCNENGGRSVLPFDGMQTGDAWLWTRHRNDDVLMNRFREFTEKKFDDRRGRYGMVGDRTVIKNTRIMKDVLIGTDAYIKGANKLKNLTINSSAESPTQIGEGCEMVNGIIGFGCKAFYGVKAVRFILASHSQLKYGARLINSFLGDNSTISCCEVLNTLLFPAHEQHHNNSFLCASALLGQSNMAAGATIGSNHNSRGADGELVAGRGFWPGLCVSLKHNSRFASYTLLAKGDFPAELDIRIPFSLVSNDVSNNRLVILPGYWFMYNMYGLSRNAAKYPSRDKRSFRNQYLEYDFLAPDTVNEMMASLKLFEEAVGEALDRETGRSQDPGLSRNAGRDALRSNRDLSSLTITIDGVENSKRPIILLKVKEAYQKFSELVVYHAANQLLWLAEDRHAENMDALLASVRSMDTVPGTSLQSWSNIGSQLIPDTVVETLLNGIRSGSISGWDEVHRFYHEASDQYPVSKASHAFSAVLILKGLSIEQADTSALQSILREALATREWMTEAIYQSRAKDYQNPFRTMLYQSTEEMERVVGSLKDNVFVAQQRKELEIFRVKIEKFC